MRKISFNKPHKGAAIAPETRPYSRTKHHCFTGVLARLGLSLAARLFFLFPLAALFLWSLAADWPFGQTWPARISLKAYSYYITSGDWLILLKTFVFSFLTALTCLLLAVLSSSALMRWPQKLALLAETLFLLPILMPVLSLCLGLHRFFLTLPGSPTLKIFLMHLYFSFPYAFIVIYPAFRNNGRPYFISARNLGLGAFQVLRHIEWPMIKPFRLPAFFLAFSVSYGQYFINYFLGGPADVNFPMLMAPLLEGPDHMLAAAYALIHALAALAVFGIFGMAAAKSPPDQRSAWHNICGLVGAKPRLRRGKMQNA